MSLLLTNDEARAFITKGECSPIKDRKQGGIIARTLWGVLQRQLKKVYKEPSDRRLGFRIAGLSAPQLGIPFQVCVCWRADQPGVPEVIMNPVVLSRGELSLPFREQCLSFPYEDGESLTFRRNCLVVDTLNRGTLQFGPSDEEGSAWTPDNLLMSCVAQRHIGYLFGLLMSDFANEVSCPDPISWYSPGCSSSWSPGSTANSPE